MPVAAEAATRAEVLRRWERGSEGFSVAWDCAATAGLRRASMTPHMPPTPSPIISGYLKKNTKGNIGKE